MENVREFVNFAPIGWDKIGVALFGWPMRLVIALITASDFELGLGLLGGALLMGLIYGLWNTEPRKGYAGNKKSARKVKICLATMAILIPLIATKSQRGMLDHAMRLIGVRNEGAVVEISEKYAKLLESNGVTPESPITKDGAIYKQVTILFQGIGKNVVLEIGGVKLVIDATDLAIALSGTPSNTSNRTARSSASPQAAPALK